MYIVYHDIAMVQYAAYTCVMWKNWTLRIDFIVKYETSCDSYFNFFRATTGFFDTWLSLEPPVDKRVSASTVKPATHNVKREIK